MGTCSSSEISAPTTTKSAESTPVIITNEEEDDVAHKTKNVAVCSGNNNCTPNKCGSINNSKDKFMYKKGICALEFWEPIQLLGEGSISVIHLIRRREERVNIPYRESADYVMRHSCSKGKKRPCSLEECSKNHKIYALKSIMKDHIRNGKYLDEMRSEIETLSSLCHPNIVPVFEGYERKRHIYLIMQYCSGGDLLTMINNSNNKHNESTIQIIVKHILMAVSYLHDKKIVHRDLKLENIMFLTPECHPNEIQLIDFGLATKYISDDYKTLTEKVGTIYTMAPQVLQGVYDYKCDLWSIGVITYMLLASLNSSTSTGSPLPPFWGPVYDMPWKKRRMIMIDRIMRCEYKHMKHGVWDTISKEAKNFVQSLLQLDPEQRPTAQQALDGENYQQSSSSSSLQWMTKTYPRRQQLEEEDNSTKVKQKEQQQEGEEAKSTSIVSTATTTTTHRHIKTMIISLIANNVGFQGMDIIRKSFHKYDTNNTGRISHEQLCNALIETKLISVEQISKIIELNGVGSNSTTTTTIEYSKLILAAISMRGRLELEEFAEAFEKRLCNNCNCRDNDDLSLTMMITVDELRNALKDDYYLANELLDDIIEKLPVDQQSSSSKLSCNKILDMVITETKKKIQQQIVEVNNYAKEEDNNNNKNSNHDVMEEEEQFKQNGKSQSSKKQEKEEEENELLLLVNSDNASIPGGRKMNDNPTDISSSTPIKFVYDRKSQSLRSV